MSLGFRLMGFLIKPNGTTKINPTTMHIISGHYFKLTIDHKVQRTFFMSNAKTSLLRLI